MNADLKQLTDAVARGIRSRGSIRREFGDETYRAVGREIARREEARRAAAPAYVPPPAGICTCCLERPVWSVAREHGQELCEQCSHDDCCTGQERDCTNLASDHLFWEESLCEACQRDADWCEWLDETLAAVAEAAAATGWSFDPASYSGGFNTRSRYYTIDRGDEEIKLRISDHGDCYCNDDLSLAMQPSGDDTTLAGLRARLSRKEKETECTPKS